MTKMKIEVEKEEIIFDEFFRVKKAYLRHEKFNGTMSPLLRRYSFEKNNAVAAIIYHVEKDAILLVRQHRYPPMVHGLDWVTEVVAGGLNEGEDESAAIIREIEEESVYRPTSVKCIHDFYVSPGVFTERLKLYYAEITEAEKINGGGGLDDEDEDIELVWVPRKEIEKALQEGVFIDAKTIIGLYYILHRKVGRTVE